MLSKFQLFFNAKIVASKILERFFLICWVETCYYQKSTLVFLFHTTLHVCTAPYSTTATYNSNMQQQHKTGHEWKSAKVQYVYAFNMYVHSWILFHAGTEFCDNPLLEPAFLKFFCSIFLDTRKILRIRTYTILIFDLILTFILLL